MAEQKISDIITNLNFKPGIYTDDQGTLQQGTYITFTYRDGTGHEQLFTVSDDEDVQVELVADAVKKHQTRLEKIKNALA